MKIIQTLLALLIVGSTAAIVENAGGTTPATGTQTDTSVQMKNEVIDKAIRWLGEHPASVRDNELMEVVEEIMFFYALYSTPGYEAERPYFQREIAGRHQAIEEYLADTGDMQHHLQGDWAALTYPPLAHIMSAAGFETDTYRNIIDELVSLKRHLDPQRNAMRLWITIYLARLGLVTDSAV